MYAITGITAQIGSVIGRILLDATQPVCAVLRDRYKGKVWTERGCEVALATIEDAASLSAAFLGAETVFGLVPPH
jgi:NAD(P)H dehydrogenase (quinone)